MTNELTGMEPYEAILQKERIINLFTEINEATTRRLVGQLMAAVHLGQTMEVEGEPIETDDPNMVLIPATKSVLPMRICINSPGGSVYDMFAIYDTIQMIKEETEVETLGMGLVASAAVPILAAGTPGKRLATKHCRLMIHDVHSSVTGRFSDLDASHDETKQARHIIREIMTKTTKLTKKKYDKLMKKNADHWMGAEEALEMGIIDEIV